MKYENARKGLDYYIENRPWQPTPGIDIDGLKSVAEAYAEQVELKGPVPPAKKYVGMNYLQIALKELGWK